MILVPALMKHTAQCGLFQHANISLDSDGSKAAISRAQTESARRGFSGKEAAWTAIILWKSRMRRHSSYILGKLTLLLVFVCIAA